MKVLITGTAGFIGFHLAQALLDRGNEIVGIDNVNDYYDTKLKEARLSRLKKHQSFTEIRASIEDQARIDQAFFKHQPEVVINLAAQAGVRYSLQNPKAYIDSNLVGFSNILEACRNHGVKHLIYASSSSVYGANTSMPFSVHDNVDHPLSLYAATKKANELMAHTYSHLFKLPTTGLRFFTVYGPWGRPDMALFSFTRKIIEDKPIEVFNFGKHQRDFTYIDDIIQGILLCIDKKPEPNPNWDGKHPDPGSSLAPYKLYNIGNRQPVELLRFIEVLEESIGKKAEKIFLPMQPGDILATYADVDDLIADLGYRPKTSIEVGVANFVAWYKEYYGFA